MRKQTIRERNPKTLLFRFVDWLVFVAIGLFAVVFFAFIAATPYVVTEDTVSSVRKGDFVFIDKIGLYFDDYDRGDIIVYRNDEGELTMGRVVAYGGEHVLISGGRLYVDDCLLDETDYAEEFSEDSYAELTVLEGKLLILPDIRANFDTSAVEDCVAAYEQIVGEIRFRLYPFGEMEVFS